MAGSQKMASIAAFDLTSFAPSELLLPTAWVRLNRNVSASAGRSNTSGSYMMLPGVEENILFIQLSDRMHLDLQIDRTYQSNSTTGDITLIPRGHSSDWHTQGIAATLILSIAEAQFAQIASQADVGRNYRWELTPCVGVADPLLHAIGQSMFEQLRYGGALGELYLESLLTTLTLHLMRNHGAAPLQTPLRAQPRKGALSAALLRRVSEYIDSHLDHELSLAEIAATAQYSPFYFARSFHDASGQPLHQYVLERRLTRAAHLLETTELGLSEVAQRAGFSTHSHFTSHFKRKYHVTPSQFRRLLTA